MQVDVTGFMQIIYAAWSHKKVYCWLWRGTCEDGKVNEVLLHITTDLTYVSQDALNADEDIINFRMEIDDILIYHASDTYICKVCE